MMHNPQISEQPQVAMDIDAEIMPPPCSPKKIIEPSPDNHSVKTSESGP